MTDTNDQSTHPQLALPHLTRRRLLTVGGLLAATGLAGGLYTNVLEPRWIDIETVPLRLTNLHESLIGRRIVQISDIHLCQYMSSERLLDAIETVNQLEPDWVLITGDFVSKDASYARGLVEPLRMLNAPAFAVYGNHDYWSDAATVAQNLAETPVQLLRNQALPLTDKLWLAGVDDIWSGSPDLSYTLQEVPHHGVTTLLMAHEPDFFDNVLQSNAPIDVQFSGHSHGGQVRLPTLTAGANGKHSYAPVLPHLGQRYPIGHRTMTQENGRQVQLYTNRGLGVWPLPVRFNCRPEITLFELQRV
ncbi:MAG: metallophosphoesterase [Chloroflexota bacterium]